MKHFLRQWILEDHKEWKNNVYGQCKSWLDKGLQPRAMTRDSNWGVKVPLPEQKEKYCMFGLMHPLVIFLPQKNFWKTGKITGAKKIPSWFIL